MATHVASILPPGVVILALGIMMVQAELTRFVELFQFPFMQRALLGGILTGLSSGLLGSFAILRQLSFFSDALGESALLGIGVGLLLDLEPSWVLPPFAELFALVIVYFQERTHLWLDALLNIFCSACLALGVILLALRDEYRGGITNLLFGDILAVQTSDLIFSALLLAVCVGFIALTLRSQILLTLNEPMAIAQGVSVSAQRTAFMVLLALVIGISIKSIGILLISAFIVIPACSARLICRSFNQYVFASAGLGALSAVLGMLVSALFDFPSGPCIVVVQVGIFLLSALATATRTFTA